MFNLTPEAAVQALYRALLSRDADAAGLADKAARLAADGAALETVVLEVVGSQEFLDRMPEFLHRRGASERAPFTNDMSQHGEVWALLRAWVQDSAAAGFVVDAGARGRERSNSFDLLRELGWRGLLIEANTNLIPQIRQDFAGLDITLVNCAVSDFEGEATFTLGANDDVSSLDAATAGGWGPVKGEITVEVRRLPSLLLENNVPERFDLLSLDIEGHDIRVLNDLVGSSWHRPTWVVIEASDDFRVRSLEDAPFSPEVKATYHLRAQTKSNLILKLLDSDRA